MPSQKRTRASLSLDSGPAAPSALPSPVVDPAVDAGRLSSSLARSLHALLHDNAHHQPPIATGDAYARFLNSPGSNSSPATAFRSQARRWIDSAARTVGVGNNANILGFWRDHGTATEEAYADGRYMVWLTGVLLGPMGPLPDEDNAERSGGDDDVEWGARHLAAVEAWHRSLLDLLQTRGARPPPKKKDGVDKSVDALVENNATEGEGDDDAGVLWQMLLHRAHLTPEKLDGGWDAYISPQEGYEQAYEIEGDALPGEYFAWPSFLRHMAVKAEEEHAKENGGNGHKRRRSNAGGKYFKAPAKPSSLIGGGIKKTTAWYPLLGYAATHALLNAAVGSSATVHQKMTYLREHVMNSLSKALNIGNHDYETKHALLAGMAACVLDEVGEWTVLDGLVLGEAAAEGGEGSEGRVEEAKMNLEVCERMRAGVDEVVDVLLVEGVLSRLAALTKTRLPSLVAEAADALLNYSEVHHRLRDEAARPASIAIEGEEEDAASSALHQALAEDAKKVVQFIDRADPQLKLQLRRRTFTAVPRKAIVPGESIPLHPAVVSVRARLLAGDSPTDPALGLAGAARLCKSLEESVGVDDATKKHCWLLLFEGMQDAGVLCEDGWNAPGAGATLANIAMGHLGLQCALDYLAHIVVEAQEELLSSGPTSRARGGLRRRQREEDRANAELLCVKDAVRRTILKLLAPRAYSPREALRVATELSRADRPPELEHAAWGSTKEGRAVDVACRILAAPRLYALHKEDLEEEAAFEELKDEDEEVFEEALEEEYQPAREEFASDAPQAVRFAAPVGVDLAQEEAAPPAEEAEEPTVEEKEDEVIDLEDSEDEAVVAEPAADASAGKERVEEDITYPRRYHQFEGNYSESDEYEEEDEEEADRHMAFEGEYESDEGRGDSSGGEDDEDGQRHRLVIPERQQGQEDLVEILDSSEEEEEEAHEDEEEREREETCALNEKVDSYIAEHEDTAGEEKVGGAEDATAETGARTEQEEARILGEAVHDYIIPSSLRAKAQSEEEDGAQASDRDEAEDESDAVEAIGVDEEQENDEPEPEEIEAAEKPSSEEDEAKPDVPYPYTDDMAMADDERESIDTEAARGEEFDDTEGMPSFEAPQPPGDRGDDESEARQQPSVLVAAAMSAVGTHIDHGTDPSREPFAPIAEERDAREDQTETKSYDNTSAALESATDNANLWENYDDASQGEEVGVDGSNVQVVARFHGQDLDALAPVLDVHADADDSDESSPEDNKAAEQTDDGYVPDAEATEEEHPDRKKEARAKAIDDGYMPDAEATEEEKPPKKEERVAATVKKPVIDEGYIPDASEASEVEQLDEKDKSQNRQRGRRDVRFEADLETMIGNAAAQPAMDAEELPGDEPLDAKSQSTLDEGYIPTDDGLTEEEREKGRLLAVPPPPSIDEGYIPDGALTEEERIETRRRRRADIDRGYLPDGHTTPGDATEEDQGEEGGKVPQIAEEKEVSSQDVVEEIDAPMEAEAPAETRCDDVIDEGYLPSAVEGTEEERSEAEEDAKAKARKAAVDGAAIADTAAADVSQGDNEMEPPPSADVAVQEKDEDREEGMDEEQAMPSVLVATATALQQRHPHRRHRHRHHDDEGSHKAEVLPTMKIAGDEDNGEAKTSDMPPGVADKADDGQGGGVKTEDLSSGAAQQVMSDLKPRADDEGIAKTEVEESTAPNEAIANSEDAGDMDAAEGEETGVDGELASPYTKKEQLARAKAWHDARQARLAEEQEQEDQDHTPDDVAVTAPEQDEEADVAMEGGEVDEVVIADKAPEADVEMAEQGEDRTEDNAAPESAVPKEEVGPQEDDAGEGAEEDDEVDEANVAAAVDANVVNEGDEGPAIPDDDAQSVEDFSTWTRDELRAKLRELNLPRGKVKQDMVDILTNHFSPNLKGAPDGKEGDADADTESKAVSKSSKKRKASSASAASKKKSESATTPSTMASSRRSKREKKPSLKASAKQDTPISELSHPIDSDMEDLQEEHFAASAEASSRRSSRRKNEPSPGVPTSIVTRKKGKKSPALPVVPEGETVEGSTVVVGSAKAEAESTPEESSKQSKRSKKSTRRATKNGEASEANDDTSVASRTLRSRRGADDAKKPDVEEESTAASTRRSTRRTAAKKDEEATPVSKRGRGRPKKTEEPKKNEAEEESVPSRRSTRSTKKKDTESVSVGTRRSTRSRAKK